MPALPNASRRCSADREIGVPGGRIAAKGAGKSACATKAWRAHGSAPELTIAYKEIGGHAGTDYENGGADPGLRQFLGVMGAEVAAEDGAAGHRQGLGPEDGPGGDEGERGHAVGEGAEEHLQ